MEKIKSFIGNRSRLIIIAILFLALTLPFVINQALKQQDIRQGAQSVSPVTLTLSPATKQLAQNEEFEIKIMIDTNGSDISAVDGSLKYDPTLLTLLGIIGGENYTVQEDTATLNPYTQPITIYNSTAHPSIGSSITLATVKFKAVSNGTATVSFGSSASKNLQIAASGSNTNAPLSTEGEPSGEYIIGTPATSPIPTNNARIFNYNGGRDHCRPTGKSCESALNESEVPNSSCSSYLGVNARACRTSGYPPITNSLLSECSTLSPDGYVRYCIPNGGEIPTGWTAVTNGDSACTDYNGVASKCYKSTFLASGNNNMSPTPTAKLSPNPTAKLSPTPTSASAPTSTLAPTAAPIPGDTTVTLKAILPGVGSGASNLGLNPTPLNPQRSASIQVVKADNTVAKTVDGILTYASNSSSYTGNFSLGTSFPSGSYTVKLKFNNTLYKAVPGVLQITTGQSATVNSLTAVLVSGDLNGDNTLGVIDWTFMIACVKSEASCTDNIRKLADLNDNGSVDETDVQILQRGFALRDGD